MVNTLLVLSCHLGDVLRIVAEVAFSYLSCFYNSRFISHFFKYPSQGFFGGICPLFSENAHYFLKMATEMPTYFWMHMSNLGIIMVSLDAIFQRGIKW